MKKEREAIKNRNRNEFAENRNKSTENSHSSEQEEKKNGEKQTKRVRKTKAMNKINKCNQVPLPQTEFYSAGNVSNPPLRNNGSVTLLANSSLRKHF